MASIKHSSTVTSESLSVISKLRKPETGFEQVDLNFHKLDERISETVIDQFTKDTKQLKKLQISAYNDLLEADRPNLLELAAKIIED